MPDTKRYLGDSVYAEFDGYGIIITTENGYGPSNTIYVEPQVYAALTQFVAALKAEPPATGDEAVARG